MFQENSSVPRWVRSAYGITGCLSILLMVAVECTGVSLSPCVAGGVVLFSVSTACLAFDRAVPTAMSRLIHNKNSDEIH